MDRIEKNRIHSDFRLRVRICFQNVMKKGAVLFDYFIKIRRHSAGDRKRDEIK